jgi:hypothetical protein
MTQDVIGVCEQPALWTALPRGAKYFRRLPLETQERSQILMEWQIVRDLAGGVAETAYQGHRARARFRFPLLLDSMRLDYDSAFATLNEYCQLRRRRYGINGFFDRTRDIVFAAWPAVAALADALIHARSIEFEEGHKIIAPLLPATRLGISNEYSFAQSWPPEAIAASFILRRR